MKGRTKTFLKYTFSVLLISALIMLALFQLFFWRTETRIGVERVYSIPDYVDMTGKLDKNEFEFDKKLRKGILRINTTAKELVELKKFNSNHIKIGNIYYRILPAYASLAVQKINHTPEKYTELSEIPFPSLRKLINFVDSANLSSYARSDVSLEELLEIEKLVEEGMAIEYDSKFYRLAIDCRMYLEPVCYEVTMDDLKGKPSLEKLLEIADKSGYAMDSIPPEEWGRIQYIVYEESGNLPLEYNRSCYRVRAIATP
jgi:hypothetical protein